MATDRTVWQRFVPTPQDPWDLRKVAHLHRRAGFGATWSELHRDLKEGPQACVDRLLAAPAPTAEEQQVLDSLSYTALDSNRPELLKAWWLFRILYGGDRLREKMTLFWHSHFATSNTKVHNLRQMLAQNELLRTHALGSFADLLTALVGDAAMLVWLDGAASPKSKPNENFGREFLELFSLGIGNYSEQDIRAAARAFTGWDIEENQGVFTLAHHDTADKTFLKQAGPWKTADIVRITLEQPACAEFLCRKLYRYLVNETANLMPAILAPLAEEMRRSKYDLKHVVGVILRSRHFYAEANYRQRIKSPVELSAGLARSLEVPRADMRMLALARACELQRQDLFYPPNVKGWDGGRTWLNSTTVLERGNWCNDVIWGNPDLELKLFDPTNWVNRQGVPAAKAGPAFVDLLLDGSLEESTRNLVLRPGADGSADGLRKTLQLLLHCPEFQLS
jgi:uncharacterized protein (DUF1800 family)